MKPRRNSSFPADLVARLEFGQRLTHHRMAQGQSFDKIAELSGISASEIVQIEFADRDVTFPEILRLCDALDIWIIDFLAADMPRNSKTHAVVVQSERWHAIDSDVQVFDIRRNDKTYRIGDRLRVHEMLGKELTGRVLVAEITFLTYGEQFGLVPGTVVLALRVVRNPST